MSTLNKLKQLYPQFLDKTDESNFTKHCTLVDKSLLNVYMSLFKLDWNKNIQRPLTIQKIQTTPLTERLIFSSYVPNMTSVLITQDDKIVYEENFETLQDQYTYTLTIHSESIIPTEKVCFTVFTEEGYSFSKGYPENDTTQGDVFDHDAVLDKLGRSIGVLRYNFIEVTEDDYYTTLPPFHAKSTEDDYYYMVRLQQYVERYKDTYFPILELWKHYHIESDLVNRMVLLAEQNVDYMASTEDSEVFYSSNLINNFEETETTVFEYLHDNLLSATSYTLGAYIESSESDVQLEIIYYNQSGAVISTESSDEARGEDFTIYLTSITPPNAVSSKLIIQSENNFTLKDLNYYYQGLLRKNTDSKYMRTKHEYNSCVYDIYTNYDNLPSNVPKPTSEDIENIFKQCMPITKKAYFNMRMNTQTNDHTLSLHPTYTYSYKDHTLLNETSLPAMFGSRITLSDDGDLNIIYEDNDEAYTRLILDETYDLYSVTYTDENRIIPTQIILDDNTGELYYDATI